MKLIDTHAHLEDFTDIELVLERAKDNNVLAIIAVGSNKKSNLKILELKKQYIDLIYSAIGIHPIEAEKCEVEDINFVDTAAGSCIAIGEIGLDYSYQVSKNRQIEVFEKMLEISRRHHKPVLLHSRHAWDDVLSHVLNYDIGRGVFHWYSGPIEILNKILDRGFYVSATPAVEYNPKHIEAIQRTPVESILLETDTPVRYRGIPSEPSDVTKVLSAVAKIKGLTKERLAEVTTNNACDLFGLKF